jgi:hypothetical protein
LKQVLEFGFQRWSRLLDGIQLKETAPNGVKFAPDVPSFSGYAIQSVPEGLAGEPFWRRAIARILELAFLIRVAALLSQPERLTPAL